jgi:peptidoglycan hydrolase CwlO-like protein
MEKTNKFIKQYQLEVKELFERDYHLVDSDEEFVRRLVGLSQSAHDLQEKIDYLEDLVEDLKRKV